MTNLLLILLLLVGCESLIENAADVVNYDHCDEYSQWGEECLEIEQECDGNGIYTEIIADEPGENDICCCEYND